MEPSLTLLNANLLPADTAMKNKALPPDLYAEVWHRDESVISAVEKSDVSIQND